MDFQKGIDENNHIFVPRGAWNTPPLKVDDFTVIEGEGQDSRLIFEDGHSAIGPRNFKKTTTQVRIHDVSLHGRSSHAWQHGIHMPYCWHWDLERVDISDFSGFGVYVYGKRTPDGQRDPADSTKHRFAHCRFVRCHHGILIGGSNGTTRLKSGTGNMNTMEHCLFSLNRSVGLYLDKGAGNCIVHPILDSNGGHGMVIGWFGTTVLAPIVETNKAWGIFFTHHHTTHDNVVLNAHDGGGNVRGLHNAHGSNVVR